MKKLLKRFSILFLSILFVIVAAGCTSPVSKVSTTLKINTDGSGERIMRIDINRDDFNAEFKGTFEDLKKLIDDKKSADLSYTALDDDENFALIFNLEFSSVDDYTEKMSKIVTDYSDDDKLVYEGPDTMWKKGANIRESLTGTRAFDWLVDAIVEAGYVDSGDRGNILGASDYILYYNGEQVNNYFYGYNYRGLSQIYVSGINQKITLYNTDSFNVEYIFNLNFSSADYNAISLADFDKDGILAFFKDMAGDKAVIETDDYNITVRYENIDANGVKEANGKLFDNGSFAVTSTGESNGIFETEYTVSQSFDVKRYLTFASRNYLSVESRIEYLNGYRASTSSNKYISIADEGQGMLFESEFGFSKKYSLAEMNLETVVTDENNIKQVITFTLSDALSKTEQEIVTANVDKIMTTPSETYVTPTGESADESKFKYDYKVTTKNDKYVGELSFKGDKDKVIEGLKRFTKRDAGMNLLSNKSTFKTKYTKSFEIKYDLNNFSQYTGQDFSGTATIDLGSGATITSCSIDSALLDKNEATFRVKTSSVKATVNAECSNGFAFILIMIVVVIVLAALAALVFILLKVAKANKPAVTAGPSFCPNCGTQLEKGTAFCQNCGTKVQ